MNFRGQDGMKSDPYLCEFYDVPKKEQKTCKKFVPKRRFCGVGSDRNGDSCFPGNEFQERG